MLSIKTKDTEKILEKQFREAIIHDNKTLNIIYAFTHPEILIKDGKEKVFKCISMEPGKK